MRCLLPKSTCARCGTANQIVNECGCDKDNLPTRVPVYKLTHPASFFDKVFCLSAGNGTPVLGGRGMVLGIDQRVVVMCFGDAGRVCVKALGEYEGEWLAWIDADAMARAGFGGVK